MKVIKIKNLRAIIALASTLVLAISFGMVRPIMAIADNRLPNEQSTANWPDTKGEQLATSKYDKKETLDFSKDNDFRKDYAATPKLMTRANLSLFINGKQTDISTLYTESKQIDNIGGNASRIMTKDMGENTYFKAANMMTVLIDGKYEALDMKVTLKGVDFGNDSTSVAFGTKGPGEGGNLFLSSGSGQQIAQRGNFTNMHYQFFKHGTDIPVATKFHMGFDDLDSNEALKLDENVINKVYVDNNSRLPYQLVDGKLAITRDFNKETNITDTDKTEYTHVVIFDLDVPADGFDISISTSGHGNVPTDIKQGSKVAPSILSTMLYQGTVTTQYVDENNEPLQDPTTTTDVIGKDYKTTKPDEITKDGVVYVLVPEKNPTNADGKYIDGNIEVTYTYKKKEGTVVTKFVDVDGNIIQDPTTTTDVIGKDYKTTKPDEITKDGVVYVLVPEKNPANAEGKYIDGNTEVTYTYKKKETPAPKTGTVITHFVDEAGNKLAVDTAITDLVGNDYKTVAPSIITKDGIVYVLVPEKNPTNADGKYIDGNTEVTYTYKKKETPAPKTGTVITHFVDEAGNKLAVDTEITDLVGNDYKTVAPSTITKDGIVYVLVPEKNPANAEGKYIEGNTEVTYTYKKKETPAPPVPSTPSTPNTPNTTGQLTSVVSLPLTGENTSFLSVLGFLLMSILGLMHLKTRRKN
ncbi:MucBP domain-containing protein [Lactococcus carnosus]|uniref:MucBP domain-containing protein n=1 Tax=Pseudolactococcus carnosus TaxID=2749961 RepID=UPI001FBC0A66|nr:MucBP domain-containing protein [Lactococcus carnosus]MCJ1979795.1 LPXTG cell wall anchor domain-containing protein [Lactococcus carnosus]